MTRTRHWLVGLACVATCALAQADSDRLASDGDVAEAGDCDIELGRERKHIRGDTPERESSLRLACGIGWKTELEAAFSRRHGSGARDQAIALEAKTTLRERERGSVGWALAIGVASQRGSAVGWRRSEQFVALEATIEPARDWLVEAKLGAARERNARIDKTLWSMAVERTVSDGVELRAELEGDDRGRPLMAVGLRWMFWPEHAVLKLSYGAVSGPLRERRSGLAIKYGF